MKTPPSIQALNFFPQFFIDETQPRRFRIAFSAPSTSNLLVRGKYADVSMAENGSVDVSVSGHGPGCFKVCVNANSTTFEIGMVTCRDLDVPAEDRADFENKLEDMLTNEVQQAFFAALAGQQRPEVPAARPVRAAARLVETDTPRQGECSRWWRWVPRRMSRKGISAAVALLAVGLIVYGAIQGFSKPKDPIQQALNSDNYKELQDRIRQQIAANNGSGEFGPLQGQNIAIDTMKAMGLDPGKANSGCLVGVK